MLDEIGRLIGVGLGYFYLNSYSGKKYSRLAVNTAPEFIISKMIRFLRSRGLYPWLRRVQAHDAIQILHILYEYKGGLVGKLRATSHYSNCSPGNSLTPFMV